MTTAEVLAAATTLAEIVKDAPEIEAAIVRVFSAKRAGAPLTPALRHLEVLAAEKLLGITP